MVYIKKLVMQGFKSFVKKTELPFTHGINVILGPNGSGKSNVSDALCFVLGRLSIKSMRAAKASNLIFLGTKEFGPAKEAIVEIVFDNQDNTFSVDSKEISIKRILRKNGQSIYKINNESKTRQDVLSLLAQGGIDPNGFNIILQGEIQNFVRMHTEERRKIIEEVAGISIYETRKEKSLKELERTEEKLKEVLAVLRERTTYLNNLERERQQALKFKQLEEDIKKFKKSIIYFDLTNKKKDRDVVIKEIEKKNAEIEKIKSSIEKNKNEISSFQGKIDEINQTIQKSAGLEQEQLNHEIANLRADLAGLNVKQENSTKKIQEIERQKQELNELVRNNELSLKELNKESPTIAKKEKELSLKKKELEKLEEERKKFYMTKTELKSTKERLDDKTSLFQSYLNESDFLLKQIENLSKELFDIHSTKEKVSLLKTTLNEKQEIVRKLNERERELEKVSYTNNHEIENQNRVIEKIKQIDICPLCKSKITPEHIKTIHDEINPKVVQLKTEIENSDKELGEIFLKRKTLNEEIEKIRQEASKRESDLIKISNIENKKEQIKALEEKQKKEKLEIEQLVKRKKFLEENFDENTNIEQKYELVRVEVQEISLRSEENVNSEISFKQRELDRSKISLNQIARTQQDLTEELETIRKSLKIKEETLFKKRQEEESLTQKFQKLIGERDLIHKNMRQKEQELSSIQYSLSSTEQQMNSFRIDKARVDAEVENYEIEILEFPNTEIIKTNKEALRERLSRAQETFSKIGSVNLRSLEVYDEIKAEYDSIKEKVEIISKEKEGIMKIINEIDIKKKKTFLTTLEQLNEIFSRNFAQISTKGQVSLELEDKREPFSAGVNIIVKVGHGKYFDIKSLSGGEQTMVALSLIFAIQELKPYCFYILDEIDAALDKRNSSRLAGLLQKYMQKGQYIVITHNDEVITNATTLFGVSMHEGISKLTSLKL